MHPPTPYEAPSGPPSPPGKVSLRDRLAAIAAKHGDGPAPTPPPDPDAPPPTDAEAIALLEIHLGATVQANWVRQADGSYLDTVSRTRRPATP